jgi:uncharacterized delta-60 repeat protein
LLYSERFLVTVHREDCPAFAEIRRRYRKRKRATEHPSLLLYRVVDGLADSFFPSLAELDDRIDELEDAILAKGRRQPALRDLPDEETTHGDAQDRDLGAGDDNWSGGQFERECDGVTIAPGSAVCGKRAFSYLAVAALAAFAFRTRHQSTRKAEMTARRFRAAFAIGVALCFFAALPLSAQAAAGDLDPTFGSGGKVTTAIVADYNWANAVAVQGDGKIVAAGFCADSGFCLARYNGDGSLDTSFDSDGKVTTTMFASGSNANGVAVQGDGRIVAVGACFVGLTQFCLARYNGDGTLDTSFDVDGKVTTAMNTDTFRSGSSANAVAVQGDGKIVVGGVCFDGETTDGEMADFCLARYNGDGSLDTSFESDGEVRTRIFGAERAIAIAVQGDGKIVAAGNCHVGSATANFCLARYNSDGGLDTSFDSDGTVKTAIGAGPDYANGVALQGDGKIVAAGSCNASPIEFCLARYNSNGSLDTSFDGDGTVTTTISASGSFASAVAVQGDGKIVEAGSCIVGSQQDFCVARYNSNGGLDASFDGDGTVTTAVGAGDDSAKAVAVQSDGKIVVAGSCSSSLAIYEFCLARYEGEGTGPVDGIDDTLQPPGTPAGSFVDNTGNGKTTTGTLESGSVTVTDAADPDGVVIIAGAAGATLTMCPPPSYPLVLAPGASATVTCGSVTVKAVANGSVIVRIPGTDVSVTFAAGSSGTVESDGGISVTGASGNVTMTVSGASAPVPAGDSTLLRRGIGNDLVNGTSGNDLIFDAGGNNTINGNGGNDTIVAGSGNDNINGGDGDDWIDAGAGNNIVKGGAGNDSITAGSGNDTIDGGDGYDTCNPGLGKNNVKNCEA